jgi:hypothetical protein
MRESCRRRATASALYHPCFSAFLFPFGAPGDGPPCIRQRPFGVAENLPFTIIAVSFAVGLKKLVVLVGEEGYRHCCSECLWSQAMVEIKGMAARHVRAIPSPK